MKKFFKLLSGRPKNGNVKECFKPFITIPQLILSIVLMIMAVKSNSINSLFYGIMSIALSWQLGWGMSIERFIKDENKNK